MRDKRYSVSFTVSLMWQDKSGILRRVNARCVNLSSAGMKIETRERLEAGTVVLVSSSEFGRMGHATVRYYGRAMLQGLVGLRFTTAYGFEDSTRKKILSGVLDPTRPNDDSETRPEDVEGDEDDED